MDPEIHPESAADYLDPDQLRALQLQRLRAIVERCFTRVAVFRQRMQQRGMVPADVQSLEDVAQLPFVQKTDLRDHYPYGLFAVPMKDVVRLHASSGTTGKPIVVGYTRDDIDLWSSLMLRCFVATGIHAGDVLQNAFGYGLFTGGLGAHYGAERLGAAVIPISGGNTRRQIMVMKDFGVTAICCTPSYFVHLIEQVHGNGLRFAELGLKIGVFGAEPWTEGMRTHIQRETGIRAYDIYGLSEILGPGVAVECSQQAGLHMFEDQFLMEIVDPQTDQVLPDGQVGELVITTLTKQAFPMIRYRTHDLTAIIPQRCACGRTLRRIRRIQSRSDDMLIIRGVNVFPSQIEAALLSVMTSSPHYQIVLSRHGGLDQIAVELEVTEGMFGDRISQLEVIQTRLAHAIEQTIGLRVPVRLVEPHTIARSEGKAIRVIDQRGKKEEVS